MPGTDGQSVHGDGPVRGISRGHGPSGSIRGTHLILATSTKAPFMRVVIVPKNGSESVLPADIMIDRRSSKGTSPHPALDGSPDTPWSTTPASRPSLAARHVSAALSTCPTRTRRRRTPRRGSLRLPSTPSARISRDADAGRVCRSAQGWQYALSPGRTMTRAGTSPTSAVRPLPARGRPGAQAQRPRLRRCRPLRAQRGEVDGFAVDSRSRGTGLVGTCCCDAISPRRRQLPCGAGTR